MHRFLSILAPALAAIALTSGCAHAAGAGRVAMLPARSLTCDLGHATNVNLAREQTAEELRFDAYHRVSLFLPAIPVRTTEPPDPAYPPTEKVDKRTRITADPDRIAADIIAPFNRVVDLWPARVEMTAPIPANKVKLLIVSNYDETTRKAQLFMTNAADMATWDMDKIFAGYCDVVIEPGKRR